MFDTRPYRVFPCRILVWITTLVDRSIRFLNLGMSSTVEAHVQVLRQIPSYRELPVPQELLAEGQRQFIILRALHVAFLEFIVVAHDIRIERKVLR